MEKRKYVVKIEIDYIDIGEYLTVSNEFIKLLKKEYVKNIELIIVDKTGNRLDLITIENICKLIRKPDSTKFKSIDLC